MAGDWIKMRVDLDEDPSVIGIAEDLKIEDIDHVIGKLWRLWKWADQQTTDGNAPSVTKSWVDRYLSVTGFASAMVKNGWLTFSTLGESGNDRGLIIPKFENHNGKSAKNRAVTAKRVSAFKRSKGNAPIVTTPLPREEKNREEKNTKNPPTPQGGFDPTAFDQFWRAYPKKTKKADALKAWKKLKPDGELIDQILRAVEAHKKSGQWIRDDGQYIPNPATWINGNRWEDELAEYSPSAASNSKPAPFSGIKAFLEGPTRDKI